MSTSQLPEGYKMTEVGVIPEEWEVCRLFSLITSGPKNGYSGRSGKQAIGTLTLTLTATSSGQMTLNDQTVKRLEETIFANSDLFLNSGDVLVQRSNTLELVGTTAVFNGPSGVYVYPDLMMRLRFKKQETAHWFWRFANSSNGRIYFISVAAGSTGTMPKISGNKLYSMPIPIPDVSEQKVIIDTLSDVDALLTSLDRLIRKKRDLKQAAMQQLLSGKRRLPGFYSEWEMKRLGDVGICLRGVSYKGDCDLSTHDTHYTKRLLRSNNVQDASIVISDIDIQYVNQIRVSTNQILRKNDILICIANGSKTLVGKAGLFRVNDGYEYTFGAFMGCFRHNSYTSCSSFIFYLFLTWQYRNYISNLLAGSSINNLSPKSLELLEFSMPTLPEQIAIAQILSDMDAELSALEQRRDKTRLIKQGMMQELLTGRIRLVKVDRKL